MIVRIVKMSFRAEELDNFKQIFLTTKDKIRNFEGCKYVELLNDIQKPTIFFTYSHWESEEHLEKYRHSELFKTTWAKTKILFAEKAETWSVQNIIT